MEIGIIDSRGGVDVVDYATITPTVRAKVESAIRRAAKDDITLTPSNFLVEGEDIYLDGMDPADWLDAMTMD